jgi:hypothetical protein
LQVWKTQSCYILLLTTQFPTNAILASISIEDLIYISSIGEFMNKKKTALVAMIFMVALSLAAVAAISFATSASAVGRPSVSFCRSGPCAQETHPTPEEHPGPPP